ncbi:MAG: hypothetical protein V4714_02780 [Bacteroidota bacterium]
MKKLIAILDSSSACQRFFLLNVYSKLVWGSSEAGIRSPTIAKAHFQALARSAQRGFSPFRIFY